jgi:salicylate hydroxylase
VKDWEVYQALPLKNLSKHKAILIGDASHSVCALPPLQYHINLIATQMLPTTGQGGTQSLEDVGALAVLLCNILHKDEIPRRFKLIEDVRKERARTMQGLSGQIIGFEEMVRELWPNKFLNKTNIMNAEDHLRFNNR